jgi:hypothetical protein
VTDLPFPAVADAQVKFQSRKPAVADTNFGTLSSLTVSNSSKVKLRSYLKFNVTGITGATITGAKLRLTVTDASPDGGGVFRILQDWGEQTITWNNAPALDANVGSAGSVALGTVDIPVSSGIFTSDGSYSFALANSSANSAVYASRETANPPQLILTLG